MAIFRRPREDGSDATSTPESGASTTPARDDVGVPPYRPSGIPTPAAQAPGAPRTGATLTSPLGVRSASPQQGGARPARTEPTERRTLVVGRGISLQGTVTDAERLVVEGTVESQMIHATELNVAQSGVFKGEVQVEDAEVAGLFDGTITVRGNLVIRGSGKINGIARYRKLSVEEGGQISGRMEMLTDSGTPAAPAAVAPSPDSAPAPKPEQA